MPYVEYDEVEATCSECGRMFRSEEALLGHRAESHPTGGSVQSAGPPADPIPCSVCRESFATVAGLQRHNRRAHNS